MLSRSSNIIEDNVPNIMLALSGIFEHNTPTEKLIL